MYQGETGEGEYGKFRYYLCLQLSSKSKIIPKWNDDFKKWANYLNRLFTKVNIQMANKPIQRYSISLATRGMQIKAKEYHEIPIGIAKIKTTGKTRLWWG